MNKYVLSFLILLSVGHTGCSLNPSSKTQPQIEHNQNIQNPITIGMARSEFISKVITPSSSKLVGDQRIDTFIFYKQDSTSKRLGQALYNGLVASTLPFDSLIETVSIPESATRGAKVIIQVVYDSSDRVEKVVRIQ
ncbi:MULTISPECIES: hypothetical protein [Acinetobacter]|uniref:hypothetical protein n=1 Tax=Acinetobacter TaxID=469 RepID=UPI0021CEC20C|nr:MULTISPECIES: hypothetical protein [Acinetobacter]MCU4368450.1 hypothetical protein [Acinetobacter courvalinii]MCU4446820.1 hypothetical protein [Acinetobacter courvalinii]MEB3791119.1 hypothetical protein [Acinetobacter sp. IK40]